VLLADVEQIVYGGDRDWPQAFSRHPVALRFSVRSSGREEPFRFVGGDLSELRLFALGLQSLMVGRLNQPYLTASRMVWQGARAAADDLAADWGWSRAQLLRYALSKSLRHRLRTPPAARHGSASATGMPPEEHLEDLSDTLDHGHGGLRRPAHGGPPDPSAPGTSAASGADPPLSAYISGLAESDGGGEMDGVADMRRVSSLTGAASPPLSPYGPAPPPPPRKNPPTPTRWHGPGGTTTPPRSGAQGAGAAFSSPLLLDGAAFS